MPLRQSRSISNYPLSLLKCIVIICTMFLFWYHFDHLGKEKRGVYKPWWVWTMAVEGEIKTIEEVSWEVADNSMVMKSLGGYIDGSKLKYNEKNYKEKPKKHFRTDVDKSEFSSLLKQSSSKTVLVLGTKEDEITVNPIDDDKCGKCLFTNKANDISHAEAVVVGNDYSQTMSIPKRRLVLNTHTIAEQFLSY